MHATELVWLVLLFLFCTLSVYVLISGSINEKRREDQDRTGR